MTEINQIEEIYPMAFFVILNVKDPAASQQWYQEALGFHHLFSLPGPGGGPVLVHLRWAKHADLLLRRQMTPDQNAAKGVGVTLNFNVNNGSVDELANRARQYGAGILSEPRNQPWNARDFSVADPDGFTLTFTYGPVDKTTTMEEIMSRQAN